MASSFAAISDMKREQERLKGVFASARHAQGMKLDGKSPISSLDLKSLEHAQAGLAGLKLESNLQKPESQAFSTHHQQHRGMAAPVVKFLDAQGRDLMVSTALNAIAPGVGTLYGALSLVRQGQNAIAGSGIMPTGPQPKGSVVGAMMGSFADQSDQARGVGVPSRLAAKSPAVPKPGHADIMAKMRPDESAAQMRMQQTAAHFNAIIDQKVTGLHKLTQGSSVDLGAKNMMSDRAWQVMDPTRADKIVADGGFGNLADTGIDAERIKELATRRHVPTPAQQMALTLG